MQRNSRFQAAVMPLQISPSSSHSNEEIRPNMVISGHRKLNSYHTSPRVNLYNHVDNIVAKMEQDKALMEDTPISEQLRKEALRDLPQCLTMKRCVKSKLSKSVSQKSKRKPISVWKTFKYGASITFSKLKYSFNNFNYFELWHGTLKDIESHFGSSYASYFKFLRWLFVMNLFIAVIAFSLLAVPQIIYDSFLEKDDNSTNYRGFEISDLFLGNGFFIHTILYYGHYTNNSINSIPHLIYHMPGAYFSVTVIIYLVSFIVLAISVAMLYRRTFIETQGGLRNVYANRIFCGWDFSIATEEAAELKSSAIYHELKELLSESMNVTKRKTFWQKFKNCLFQLFTNILVVALQIGVGWAIWQLLHLYSLKQDGSVVLTALIINIFMFLLPIILGFFSKLEDYGNPRVALFVTLIRTFILGCVVIGTILAYWLYKAHATYCWENELASEVYRLIVFDFIFSVLLASLGEVLYLSIQKLRGSCARSEFNIAQHTLQIIYNQGLFWVGFLYSPILPLLMTLKMLVIWYIRQGYVRKFCKPPKRTWRAAQTQTYFMMMIFISILLVMAVHGYTLKSISPSQCGPFRNYDYIYEILTSNVANLENDSTFWTVIIYITKPGAVALIMIALCIGVYYIRECALAQKEKVKMLREMLVWLAKDKEFLLQYYRQTAMEDLGNFQKNRFLDPALIEPYQSKVTENEFNSRFKTYS